MPFAEIEGFGTGLGYGALLAGPFTPLTEVVDVDAPEEDVSDISTTHMKSAGKVKTYRSGLIEPGEAKVTINMDKTEYGTLRGFRGVTKFWQVLYADGSAEVFQGYIKKIGKKTPIDGINTVELQFKVSGDITYTPAA